MTRARRESPARNGGPYLSERQWGTVREDYSEGEQFRMKKTIKNSLQTNGMLIGLRGDMRHVHTSEQFDPAFCHVAPWDDLNTGRQTLPLLCRRDHPSPAESEVLHALPQYGKEDGGKRSQEGVKTIGTQSLDVFHTLYIGIIGSKLHGIDLTTGNPEG